MKPASRARPYAGAIPPMCACSPIEVDVSSGDRDTGSDNILTVCLLRPALRSCDPTRSLSWGRRAEG
jgi:hypothetical protein